LAGHFISQVNVAEPIFDTSLNSLTNTLAVLRALLACRSQHAHTPMAEHLRKRESCEAGCHIPTVSWKIPIHSNTSLLPLRRKRNISTRVNVMKTVKKNMWVILNQKIFIYTA